LLCLLVLLCCSCHLPGAEALAGAVAGERCGTEAQEHTKAGRVSVDTCPASCLGSFILMTSRLSD